MKKKLNKKLLNLIALCSGLTATVSLGIGGVIYSLRQSDPIYQDFLPDEVYEINSDNVLIGFRDQFLNDPTSKIYKDNFKDCHTMQIPARVTSINESAFYNGSKSTIPDFIKNLTFAEESKCSSIGNRAFINCLSLTTINFPSNLNEISNGAFINCSSITRIDFSNATNLSSIGQHAFDGCKSITSITLSNNLTTINDSAFVDCTSLTSVDFSNAINLCSIGDGVFNGCSSLVSVDLSKCTNLSLIDEFAFNRCSSLTSVIFPSSLITINYAAFSHCEKLSSSIDLSNCDNLSSIGNYAFEDCSALISVSFPTNLNEIGKHAFTNCPKLNSITWDAWKGNITFPYSNAFSGVCPDGGTVTVTNPIDDTHDSTALLEYLLNNGGLPESWRLGPELPESVYDINDENVLLGFRSGIDLSKYENSCDTMQIPARVTSINESAFYHGSKSTIPDFIKNLTFADGSNCSSIGGSAFYKCYSLTTMTFPSSLTEFNGKYAFSECTALTSVDLSNCSNMSSISIHAFSKCSSLSTVKFPPNLREMKSYAFSSCTSLTTINLPQTFRTFEDYSLVNTGLTSLDLSNTNLTKVGTYSISHNPQLTSVILPRSLTYVNTWTFNDCPLLNHIAWDIITNFQRYGIFEDGDVFDKISETGTIESLNPSVSSTQLLEFFKSKLAWIGNHDGWSAKS